MGVCKCKQRNVTNQFCYVCRMNVCESCIVKDHQRCIIKSYVHWLQDSDYNAVCLLCMESINNGEVIRLTCYDIFHWDCFNDWALKHSEYTPASGFQCPDCKTPVFPPAALISPVADVIRQKFASVGWGRRYLGLPPKPIQETKTNKKVVVNESMLKDIIPTASSTPKSDYNSAKPILVPISKQHKQPSPEIEQKTVPVQEQELQNQQKQGLPQQQQQQQQPSNAPSNAATYVRDKFQYDAATPHKVIDSRRHDDSKINVLFDHDDNKYKRKGFTHWLGNLLNMNKSAAKKGGETGLTFKRVFVALVLFAIAFMTIVYFMSKYGRNLAASDPMLDPMSNPNIKVAGPGEAVAVGAGVS